MFKQNLLLNSRVEQIDIFLSKLTKGTVIEAVSYPLHEGVVEIEIMDNAKSHCKHFLSLEQVADIRL